MRLYRGTVIQHDEKDCGAAVVSTIFKYYGLNLPQAVVRELVQTDHNGSSMLGLYNAFIEMGFTANGSIGNREEFIEEINSKTMKLPLIARVIKNEMYEHFVVIYKISKNGKFVILGDPAIGGISVIRAEKFFSMWTGHIIVAQPGENFIATNKARGEYMKYIHLMLERKKLLLMAAVFSLIIALTSIFSSSVMYLGIEKLAILENETNLNMLNFSLSMGNITLNIKTVIALISVVYLMNSIINILRSKVLSILDKEIADTIFEKVYQKMLHLPLSFFETHTTGEVLSRIDDISDVSGMLSGGLLTILLDGLIMISTAVLLFFMNYQLTVKFICLLLVYVIIVLITKKPIANLLASVRIMYGEILNNVKQTIDAIITIKSCSDKQEKKKAATETYSRYTKIKSDSTVLETVQTSVVSLISNLGVFLILLDGLSMSTNIGVLLIYYNVLSYCMNSTTNMLSLQFDIQASMTSVRRLNDILDVDVDARNEGRSNFELDDIVLANVDFRYGGGKKLFENFCLEIPKGKKIAIVGDSGSGKSTLAKIIAGFYQLESGETYLGKTSINAFSEETLRKQMVYLNANAPLFEDTIRNNIVLNRTGIDDEQIKEILSSLELDMFIENLPYKYDTLIDENGSMFSSGQRQLLNLARVLIQPPKVLILDESYCNLDETLISKINKILDSYRGKMTCIIIAHDCKEVENCDQVIKLANAKIDKITTRE